MGWTMMDLVEIFLKYINWQNKVLVNQYKSRFFP